MVSPQLSLLMGNLIATSPFFYFPDCVMPRQRSQYNATLRNAIVRYDPLVYFVNYRVVMVLESLNILL